MDGLAGRDHLTFDGIEETDELLVPVALHAAADHRAVQTHKQHPGRSFGYVHDFVIVDDGVVEDDVQEVLRDGARRAERPGDDGHVGLGGDRGQ